MLFKRYFFTLWWIFVVKVSCAIAKAEGQRLNLITHIKGSSKYSEGRKNVYIKGRLFGIRGGEIGVADSEEVVLQHRSLLIDSVLPGIKAIFLGGDGNYSKGLREIQMIINIGDILILSFITFGLGPALRFLHRIVTGKMLKNKQEYENSMSKKVGKISRELGLIGIYAYGIELFAVFLKGWNHKSSLISRNLITVLPRNFAIMMYGWWAAKSLARVTSIALRQYFSNPINFRKRRLHDNFASLFPLYDRLIDTFVYITCTIVVLDMTDINVGSLLKSIVAVGGFSSVIIGLALRGPAEQIVSGFFLLVDDHIIVGDKVRLGSGETGTIESIGWKETTFRGSDNIAVGIPNKDMLALERVSNLSRTKISQIEFKIRLSYEDIGQVRNICDTMKKEIASSCATTLHKLKVYWSGFGDDHILLRIDGDFRVQPKSSAFLETQEAVFFAVAKAMKKMNVKFALPREKVYYVDEKDLDDYSWV